MKKMFLLFGKNAVLTVIITVITLVVFATSVYGIVKATNFNKSIGDIPEVESVSDKAEISPTPSPEPFVPTSTPTPVPTSTPSPIPLKSQNIFNHDSVMSSGESRPEVRKKDDDKDHELDNNLEDTYDDDQNHPEGNDK